MFQLECSESYTCNTHGAARIEGGVSLLNVPVGRAFETLLALNYNSFILTVGIIGACIYSIEGGGHKVFDARAMYGNWGHSERTCVLLDTPSMHKLVHYYTNCSRLR